MFDLKLILEDLDTHEISVLWTDSWGCLADLNICTGILLREQRMLDVHASFFHNHLCFSDRILIQFERISHVDSS
jgi:hypothetical protein